MVNETMPAIYDAMSIDDIQKQIEMYQDNPSVVAILNGYIEVKRKELVSKQVEVNFNKEVQKLVDKLNKMEKPNTVYNIYIPHREVEEEDTTQEPEEVEVTNEAGETVKEVRYPKIKNKKWISELNKGFQVRTSTSASGKTSVSKRAITVKRINPDDTLSTVGNFPSASIACKHLSIPTGGDSATRVLQRDGYLIQPYEGSEYTAS